jgi:hypothetical protein
MQTARDPAAVAIDRMAAPDHNERMLIIGEQMINSIE